MTDLNDRLHIADATLEPPRLNQPPQTPFERPARRGATGRGNVMILMGSRGCAGVL